MPVGAATSLRWSRGKMHSLSLHYALRVSKRGSRGAEVGKTHAVAVAGALLTGRSATWGCLARSQHDK